MQTNGRTTAVDVAKAKGRLRPEELEHLKTFVSTVNETEHGGTNHPETGEPRSARRLRPTPGGPSVGRRSTSCDLAGIRTRPENTVRWHGVPSTSPSGTTVRRSTMPSTTTGPGAGMSAHHHRRRHPRRARRSPEHRAEVTRRTTTGRTDGTDRTGSAPAARAIWLALSPVHHPTEPYLLGHAASRSRSR